MSKIDDMVNKLCPNGVEYKTLEELGSFYGGLTGKTKKDFEDGNAHFISYMNVYSNIEVNLEALDYVQIGPNEQQNTVEYGDVLFTGSSETPDECGMSSVMTKRPSVPCYLNSFCFGFRFYDSRLFIPGFTKYLFRDNNVRKSIRQTASGVTRFNVSKKRFAKLSIPVPPLPVQEEIVRILDSFTQLEAELEAELEARKNQYDYYRDKLLSFDELNAYQPGKIRLMPLGEIATITRGKRFVHADAVQSGVPCIHYGEIYTYYGISATTARSHIREDLRSKMRYATCGDVIVVGAGENKDDIGVAVAWNGKEPVAIHDACYILHHTQDAKYISYFTRTDDYHKQLKRIVSEGKICSFSANNLGRIVIPVPPIPIQKEIVRILDKFDALLNDLTRGLPAELAARRQQYEYYRDRLLSFKKRA